MTTTQKDVGERALDNLAGEVKGLGSSIGVLRESVARAQGETSATLTSMSQDIKALNGLFERVAAQEKETALLRERFTNFETNINAWRAVSDDDRKNLHTSIDKLNEFRWMLVGALIVGQIVVAMFGDLIRHALGLP